MIKIRMKLKTMLILDVLFTLVEYTLTFIVHAYGYAVPGPYRETGS